MFAQSIGGIRFGQRGVAEDFDIGTRAFAIVVVDLGKGRCGDFAAGGFTGR